MPATIDGVQFAVDPTSVSWGYRTKVSVQETIGGKVIQILGVDMTDLVVQGTFGKHGVERQKVFLEHLRSIAERQVTRHDNNEGAGPVLFNWPETGWSFWVYLKGVLQAGTSMTRQRTVEDHAPRYQITFSVYQDNGDIVAAAETSAQIQFITGLTQGLGWQQTEWNGPGGVEDLEETLAGETIYDFLFNNYGHPIPPSVSAQEPS